MSIVIADRVAETSTTSGTGTIDLAGAVAGYQSFVSGIGTGNQTYYALVSSATGQWETGLGTVTLGTGGVPNRLSRDTVYSGSSGSGVKVNFTATTTPMDVFCTVPATKITFANASGGWTVTGTLTTSGQLTVSGGGFAVTGNSMVTGALNVTTSLGQSTSVVTLERLGASSTGGVLDWNDVSNTRPGTGTSLLYGTATNGPTSSGSQYFHSFNLEYQTKNGAGNITQFAIPYANQINSGIYWRGRYSGAWSAWAQIWTSTTDGAGSGLDADLLDGHDSSYFLATTGGTVTGQLTLQGSAAKLSVGGTASVGTTPNSSYALFVQHGALTGTTQIGVYGSLVANTAATTSGVGVEARVNTVAATFTLTNAYHFYAGSASVGAGSTITNQYGLFMENMTGATTNYAIYTNAGYNHFGDAVAITNSASQFKNFSLWISLPTTASSGVARGLYVNSNLLAAANNDTLTLVGMSSSFTVGSYTGVTCIGMDIPAVTQGGANYAIRTSSGAVTLGDVLELRAAATARGAGLLGLGNGTQTTVGANGAASAPPANPLGYLIAYLGSTKIVIPYYNG